MGRETGRKTYFKKENDKLTKIKYSEYRAATKPAKIKKTRTIKKTKNKKLPEIDDTLNDSTEHNESSSSNSNDDGNGDGNDDSNSDEKIHDSDENGDEPKDEIGDEKAEISDDDGGESSSDSSATKKKGELPKKKIKKSLPVVSQSSSSSSNNSEKRKSIKKSKFFSGAILHKKGTKKIKRRKSKSPRRRNRNDDDEQLFVNPQMNLVPGKIMEIPQPPSMDKVTAVISDLISRKDRIAEILGSSFTDESLGIQPGHSVITPSYPMSTLSSNTSAGGTGAAGGTSATGGTTINEAIREAPSSTELIDSQSGGDEPAEPSDDSSHRPFNMHVFSRTIEYAPGINRFPVPDEFIRWDKQYPDYLPTEFSDPLKDSPVAPDPIDITKINHKEFTDKVTRPYRYGSFVHYSFDHSGRPLNPYGRTGLRGKGLLRFWGPNWYVFPLFIRRHKQESGHAVIELMVLTEDTKFYCAMPSCATADYSTIAISAKLDSSLKQCNVNEESFIRDDKLISNVQLYVDSKKNTDNAWVMACAYVYNVGSAVIKSDCVSWVPLESFAAIKDDMDEEHYQIILELIGEEGINIDPVEPEESGEPPAPPAKQEKVPEKVEPTVEPKVNFTEPAAPVQPATDEQKNKNKGGAFVKLLSNKET